MRREEGAGILLTIIFHLVVIIILLILGLDAEKGVRESFYIDFSKQEEEERQKEEAARKEVFKEDVKTSVDRLIAASREGSTKVRNARVNGALKDDRNSAKDVEELYKDAEELQKDLQKKGEVAAVEDRHQGQKDEKHEESKAGSKPYSGPSVLRWELDGRKAYRLPIPAYRCFGEGEVTVFISVNRQGKVVGAKVDDSSSSSDGCLRSYAISAAKMSQFNPGSNFPDRQAGYITYSFIAQ